MSQAFPVSGNIEPASFPHLLVDLHRRGATGSLKVNGPSHPKALYFRSGRILFGSSNDPRDQLGAILIESGKISRQQLDEVNAKVGPGNPLAKVLAESGFVNQRELGDAARVKVERILADLLSWSAGSFEFEDGVLPKGAVDLKLSTERLLLAAVQRIPDRAFALRHVEMSTVLEAVPDADSALSEIRADVWPLLERLDGRRTLKDAIALTRIDEFEAAKTACALLFLGAVRVGATGAEELDLAQEAQNGFGGPDPEPPMFTMPVQPITAPQQSLSFLEPAAAEVGSPAFAAEEPDAPAFAPSYAEPAFPEHEPLATVALPVEPEPLEPGPVEPEPVEPEPAEGTLFPAFVQAEPEPDFGAGPESEATLVTGGDGASELAFPEPVGDRPKPSELFATPPRPATDTEPGDRAAYRPAEPEPDEIAAFEAPSAAPQKSLAPPRPQAGSAPSRPSQEDLAALDALLHPSATGRSRAVERAQPPKWEPQFPPQTAAPRRPPSRTAPSTVPSRLPIVVAGVAGVALTTVAAWYFLLHSPSRTTSPTRAVQTPTPLPVPPTTLPAATEAPASPTPPASAPLAASPTSVATPAPTTAATPTPRQAAALAPKPTPTPRPAAPAPEPAAPKAATGDGRALLNRGALPEAARAFASSLAGSHESYSIQVLVACAAENVQKAVGAANGAELFILPATVQGRTCYRVCWGVYGARPEAEAALGRVPAYFRQGGGKPRLATLAELLR